MKYENVFTRIKIEEVFFLRNAIYIYIFIAFVPRYLYMEDAQGTFCKNLQWIRESRWTIRTMYTSYNL